MWTGYGRSVNTYYVWLEEQIGPQHAVEMAKRLGIRFNARHDRELAENGADSWGPFTLGVVATTPLELANAYATVAANGVYCKPTPVVAIRTATGAGWPLTVRNATRRCRRRSRPRPPTWPAARWKIDRSTTSATAAPPRWRRRSWAPAGGRQDGKRRAEHHGDIRRVHAADSSVRHRRQSQRSLRQRRLERLALRGRGGAQNHGVRAGGQPKLKFPKVSRVIAFGGSPSH